MKVRRRLVWMVAIAVALAAIPVVALARDGTQQVVLGWQLQFTGPSSAAGSFVASGGIRDTGTSTVEFSLVPLGRADTAKLTGTQRFAGARGTIVTRFRGIAHDVSQPLEWARGTRVIVEATGAYAGMVGNAAFTVAVDTAGSQLIGTDAGHVR